MWYFARYRVLWRPRHCDVKSADGDDVTIVMEYHGERGDGKSVESEKAVAMKLNKQQGQTINNVQAGLMGICLGEKRRLLIEVSPKSHSLTFTMFLILRTAISGTSLPRSCPGCCRRSGHSWMSR